MARLEGYECDTCRKHMNFPVIAGRIYGGNLPAETIRTWILGDFCSIHCLDRAAQKHLDDIAKRRRLKMGKP